MSDFSDWYGFVAKLYLCGFAVIVLVVLVVGIMIGSSFR
jgi:hypothetical protein